MFVAHLEEGTERQSQRYSKTLSKNKVITFHLNPQKKKKIRINKKHEHKQMKKKQNIQHSNGRTMFVSRHEDDLPVSGICFNVKFVVERCVPTRVHNNNDNESNVSVDLFPLYWETQLIMMKIRQRKIEIKTR